MKGKTEAAVGIVWLLAVAAGVAQAPRPADVSAAPTAVRSESALSAQQLAQLSRWLTSLARDRFPDSIERKKNWGATTPVFNGIGLRWEAGRVETYRKSKLVSHGTWTLYRVRLRPGAEALRIQLNDLEVGPSGMSFDLTCMAPLELFGRVSRWERGVQLLSISAEGGADVRLRARGTIRWQFETRDSLPVVVLEPQIRTADVQLVDFDLRRISQLHGPVVEELGRGLRHELENELQARQEDLVGAINRELNRKRSRLTFSLAELLTSPWSRLLRPS